ncbi:MAG: twin-arginine translocase subunit TatC [Phycisphaerae bacterium]|jgi:sec-independent protein translocase protein TatC
MAENNEHKFREMSLGDHLEELRIRIIFAIIGIVVSLAVCMFFSKFFLALLAKPFFVAVGKTGAAHLQAITLSEKFMVYLKTTILFSIIFSSPWIFYQLWQFVSAGLYQNEKKYVYVIVPACAMLFISGAAFYLLGVAPTMIKFFVFFDTGIDSLTTQITLENYVNFMIIMTMVFGLCFQLPIAIIALNRIGIVSLEQLKKARKYAILIIVIVAGVITPSPDMISQVALAVPMYILYELGILFCRKPLPQLQD